MSEFLLSIIIPVYKAEHTIERCVRSALDQAPPHTQMILVEDGSPDQSGLICDRLAAEDDRIQVIHQPNSGASAARNRGLEEALGQYIQFIDSDDFLAPGLYKKALPILEQKDDLDLFVFGIRRLSGGKEGPVPNGFFEQLPDLPGGLAHYFIETGLLTSPVNKIYRASLAKICRFDPSLRVYEDFLFNLDILSRCRSLFFCPDEFYIGDDLESGSLSRSQRADLLDASQRIAPKLPKFLICCGVSPIEAQNFAEEWQRSMAGLQLAVLLGRSGDVSFSDCRRVFSQLLARRDWHPQLLGWVRDTYTSLPRFVLETCIRCRMVSLLALLCRLLSRLRRV